LLDPELSEHLTRLSGVTVQDGNGRETGGELITVNVGLDGLGEPQPNGL